MTEPSKAAIERPNDYEPAQILENGNVKGPRCCNRPMADDGGCSTGCCDDYKCQICGFRTRVEWPD